MLYTISRRVAYLLLILCALSLFYSPLPAADLGWHLSVGEWIFKNKQVPTMDVFSFTDHAQPWLLSQWLGSTLLYAVYGLAAEEGLKVFRALIFLAPLLLYFFHFRNKVPDSVLLIVLVCFMFGLDTRLLYRPFIFNFAFITLLLLQLKFAREHIDIKSASKIFLLGVVWGQIHLGSFVYGVFIIVSYFLAALIEYFLSKDKQSSLSKLKNHAVILLAYLIALAITPYGIEGALYPYKVFLLPKFINVYTYSANISENLPPAYLYNIGGLWAHVLILLTALVLAFNKKRDLGHCLLYVFALIFFVKFSRASAFFAVVCGFIILTEFRTLNIKQQLINGVNQIIVAIALPLLLVLCFHVNNAYAHINGRTVSLRSLNYTPEHPYHIKQYIEELNIRGNVFCNEHIGSYLIFKYYPEIKPFVNGRQLDKTIFDQFRNSLIDPQGYFPLVDKEHHFNAVILDVAIPASKRLILFLNAHPDWTISAVKNTFIVFQKNGSSVYENNISHAIKHPSVDKLLMELIANDKIKYSTLHLHPTIIYIDLLEEGVTLNELGYYNASLFKFINAASIDPALTKLSIQP